MMDDSIYLWEMDMKEPLYEANEILNVNLTEEEIRRAIRKAKPNKAAGNDQIPNEALKNEAMIIILKKNFQ